ncbi:MAG: sulfatase [Candidatus Eiseniibacteriota bacterium]
MTDPHRPTAAATLAAGLALAATVGAAAGLADAAVDVVRGDARSLGFVVLAASLGAAAALLAGAPVALAVFFSRPRRPAAKLAVVAVALALAPGATAVGRRLLHGIPWNAGEWALAVLAVAALLGVCALAARIASAVSAAREAAAVRFLSRALLPALLLVVPAALRILPALGPPTPVRAGSSGDTNLLLVTVDTLRPDGLGCTGSATARTPWMDRLARRSVLFADCATPAPWTLPSLATLLTGAYPGEHRVVEEISGIADSVTTLAEHCRRSGLRTAAFVSNPWLAPGGLARGFDTFDVAERLECVDLVRTTWLYRTLTKTALRAGRLDAGERISRQGVSWIERGEGAWFLWLHYFDPHLPNWPEPPFDRLFGPPPSRIGSSITVEEIRGWPEGDAARRDEVARLYDGEVCVTDRAIGRVVRALVAGDALDRTAVVLAADHGEELWDHDGYGHGHVMHDEVVRVPFVVRPPGGTDGRVERRLVSLTDLAATALSVAGISDEGDAPRGRDLLAAAGGPEAAAYAAYGEAMLYGDEQKFLRTGPWRIIWTPPLGTPRLFDVSRDPAERMDLAASQPALADSLLGSLQAWIAAVGSSGGLPGGVLPESVDQATADQLRALGYIH